MDTLPIDPDDAIDVTRRPKVRVASFGDGYEQRLPDGLNHNPQTWTLVYENKKGADIEVLDAFFVGLGGVDAFLWTPTGESTARKFVCAQHSRSYDHYTAVNSLTAQIREVFE